MQVVRKQIPLQAANGMTINKSQNSSLEKVLVVCYGNRISHGRIYVACSIATSLNGLSIFGTIKHPLLVGSLNAITKEMEELQNTM